MTGAAARDRSEALVSVVMSTYNGSEFLAAQLDSILAQSHRNLEILIRDDASTDATASILLDYAAKDERIRVDRSPRNRGLVANLERLLPQAQGEYIATADQDDIWRPEKIAMLLERIGAHAAIYSASSLIDAAGNHLGRTLIAARREREAVRGRDPLALFWNNTVSGHALLFRRSLVERLVPFDPRFLYDHLIAIRSMTEGGLAYCDVPLVLHRIHGGNQNNARVLGRDRRESSGSMARTFAGKLLRRSQARRNLVRRLEFYRENSLLESLDAVAIRRAGQSARAYGHSFFNPALFLILIGQPRLFDGRVDRFRRALHYAKGGRGLKWSYRLRRRARPGARP